ncbi:MAG: hypothetical protein Fur002_03800 [Anaerolineales bacterium]
MKHPLEGFPQPLQKRAFSIFLFLTLLFFAVFRWLDAPLQTAAAPYGIVSFELAWTLRSAQAMMDSWDAQARLFAAFGLGVDYLFMPTYALALSFGLLLARQGASPRWRVLTAWLGWGAFGAALCDALENAALWQMLSAGATAALPFFAALCASIKFMLLALGLLAAVLSLKLARARP